MAENADTPDRVIVPAEKVGDDPTSVAPTAEQERPQLTASDDPAVLADEAEEYDGAVAGGDGEAADTSAGRRRMSLTRLATVGGLTALVAVAGLTGWLGFRAYETHQADAQRDLFLRAARQEAVNMTSVDWEHPDADIHRILDSATGTFHEDFATRSQPFIDAVKKFKSKSVGTVTEAGVESTSSDAAQVLVDMSVKTTLLNQPEQPPRSWRMRISVQKVSAGQAKISNVAFVP